MSTLYKQFLNFTNLPQEKRCSSNPAQYSAVITVDVNVV